MDTERQRSQTSDSQTRKPPKPGYFRAEDGTELVVCLWPVVRHKKQVECGWTGRSLRPHLKAHKNARTGKACTIEQYTNRFPEAYLGEPSYKPSAAEVKRFRDASPFQPKNKTADPKQEPQVAAHTVQAQADAQREIEQRFEELWGLVQRDPAAKNFCREVAEDEQLLKQARENYKTMLLAGKKPAELAFIGREIGAIQERLREGMKHLALSVEQRRKLNSLGANDTVAQLISNYAGTLRKWSQDRRDLFHARVATIREVMAERLERTVLSEVQDTQIESDEENGSDLNSTERILQFSKRASNLNL